MKKKITKFDHTISLGIGEFIKFLDSTLDAGTYDSEVSAESYALAVHLRNEIYDSLEKYSEKMLKMYDIED